MRQHDSGSRTRTLTGITFRDRVYALVAQIPHGRVTTYGVIARALSESHRAREVGWALVSTPEGHGLPAHRVVNRRGALTGGWAFGGEEVQRAMLEAEDVAFLPDGRVHLKAHLWEGPLTSCTMVV